MQRLKTSAALALVLLAPLAASVAPDSCVAEQGHACAAAAPRQKVAEALAAEADKPLELLQRAAGGVEKVSKAPHAAGARGGASAGASAVAGAAASAQARLAKVKTNHSARAKANHSAKQVAILDRAIRALEAAYAKRSHKALRMNYTRSKECSAFTGGTCLLSPQCDESRQAECQASTKMCVCPDYTCDNNGKCELSPSEIANAVANGVSGVADKVTSVCSVVPGLADSVSGITAAISGISDTLSGILGSLTGSDQSSCSSRFMGTCFWSDCDPDLGFTVSCEYGSCQCKEGFCAMDGKCQVDLASLVASAFQTD